MIIGGGHNKEGEGELFPATVFDVSKSGQATSVPYHSCQKALRVTPKALKEGDPKKKRRPRRRESTHHAGCFVREVAEARSLLLAAGLLS